MENDLQKKYGLPTAIALVVGIVIGSGVFFKAEKILTATGGNGRALHLLLRGGRRVARPDVLAYLSVFAVIMALSIPFYRPEAKTQ